MQQIERQYLELSVEGQPELDFSPFLAALETTPPEEFVRIEALLAGATINTMQQAMASGDLTARQLVLFYIERIRQHDADFNSVLQLNPDALLRAETLDQQRLAGDILGPLHGIPVLIKDNIAVAGRMNTTAGAKALKDATTDRDAFLIAQLRDVGAIILGKTNLSEWANFMTSESANGFSALGGQTRNAHGHFDVGGSSSGSGVAVAQNFAAAAIGTETSGSLVSPASQNAVMTLKPSLGLISRDRIIPITEANDTAGPMTRTVTDLAVMMDALVGVDANDPMTEAAANLQVGVFTQALGTIDPRQLRVGVIHREEEYRTGDEIVLAQVIAQWQAMGAEIVEISPLEAEISLIPVFIYGMHRGVDAYLEAIGEHAPMKTLAEIVAFNAADLPNRAPFGQDLLEQVAAVELNAINQAAYEKNVQTNRQNAQEAIRDILEQHQLNLIVDINNYSSAIYATAGFPALSIPAGTREDGEPFGITLIGDFLQDVNLVAAGYAYEQAKKTQP